MTYLDKLAPGQSGRVIGFTDDSRLVRRMFDLGIQPGRSITYVRNAPLADPMEILVGSNCLTLRHEEASLIAVEVEE